MAGHYGDGKLNPAAADKYIAALENGVLTVEEGIAFLESAEGKAKFGDNAASMLEHMKSLKAAGKAPATARPARLRLKFWSRSSIWPRSPSGSSAATAGPMISVSAVWTTCSLPAKT